MCYTYNVVRIGGGGQGGSADLAQTHTWNLDLLPPSPCWQMEKRAQHNSLINSCTCHTLCLHRQRLSFCFTVDGHFPFFLHFLLTPFPFGRIKFNCIVYDRYGVRFGSNSRQTVHRHFMVSFHLTYWCVVVTHLTKTIQGWGLGGELRLDVCVRACVCV